MTSKVFIDTNILVYCLDNNDKRKQKKCKTLLKTLERENAGVLSTQVMQEFYVVATQKLKVDPILVKGILLTFENFECVTVTPDIIQSAIDTSVLKRISFWNSLIVNAAKRAHCAIVWSENMQSGQLIEGVRIENPISSR